MFQESNFRKISTLIVMAAALFVMAGCHNNKAPNPIANIDSKQPDKVLFDRAMQFIHQNKFDQARITLQTLINTYPDSEFIARAKLAVGDSWYAEGGSAAMQQAEVEYKDFQTFFPNMPEAAEAQLKVAGIHYKEMEKPDRDFTQAKRAEDEYRQLIQQYPDSKLIPEAKERLREVQEVLAEREFRVGRFYYLRESYAAAIARLKSLVDAYPLYSQADEALFMLGETYQMQADKIRQSPGAEAIKASMIRKIEDQAASAYDKIITRYPVMGRKDDAIAKLKAMNRPVPEPTPEAIAQNKAEEESRGDTTRFDRIMGNFHKGPDVAHAAKIGEPTMEDPKQTNATDVVKNVVEMAKEASTSNSATAETVKGSAPKANEPVPRSDAGDTATQQPATPSGTTGTSNDGSAPAPPPTQVNDAKTDSGSASSTTGSDKAAGDKKTDSTSKPKKKKGFKKLIPF